MLNHFDPLWRPVTHAAPRRNFRSAAGLACPLAFSVIGLLLDGVASFGGSSDPQLALLRFAVIAGAPAVATLAAFAINGEGTLA
jgi:hypothetical protein